jgi:hypothetical protein
VTRLRLEIWLCYSSLAVDWLIGLVGRQGRSLCPIFKAWCWGRRSESIPAPAPRPAHTRPVPRSPQLNLGDPAGALSHCDAVLAAAGVEQATRVKAQHRRAQALRRLGRLEEALEAYK